MNNSKNENEMDLFTKHAPEYLTKESVGMIVESGNGVELVMSDGSTMIDFASGNFGYSNPVISDAVLQQVNMMPLSNRVMVSRPLADLVVRLHNLCPDPLSVSYLCNSGEEAFDAALKLSKGYNPSRNKIIAVNGCKFGTLSYGILCSGIGHQYLDALGLEVVHVEPGDINSIMSHVDSNTMAVVYEPVLTTDQVKRLDEDYINAIRNQCNKHAALMLAYEVKTGLGFTGDFLASNYYDSIPDIVVLGGALSGGIVPIGAYVTSKIINDKVYAKKNPSLHGSTTGGNPASCVAACSALNYIEEHDIVKRHKEFEKTITSALEELIQESRGNFSGPLGITGSLASFKCINSSVAKAYWKNCLKAGILLKRPDNEWVQINPPLTVTEKELTNAIKYMSKALSSLLKSKPMELAK